MRNPARNMRHAACDERHPAPLPANRALVQPGTAADAADATKSPAEADATKSPAEADATNSTAEADATKSTAAAEATNSTAAADATLRNTLPTT